MVDREGDLVLRLDECALPYALVVAGHLPDDGRSVGLGLGAFEDNVPVLARCRPGARHDHCVSLGVRPRAAREQPCQDEPTDGDYSERTFHGTTSICKGPIDANGRYSYYTSYAKICQ